MTRPVHRGCFVWTLTPPLAGRRTPLPGTVRVCVCLLFLARSGGPASRARFGAPHLFLWPFCLSALLGPLRAGVAPILVLFLPSPPPFAFFFVSLLLSSLRPLCLLLALLSGPGCPGPWRCVLFVLLASRFLALPVLSLLWCCLAVGCSLAVAPPSPFVSRCCRCSVSCFFFFLLFLLAPPLSPAFSGFRPRVPWALGLCVVCFSGPPAARLSVRSRLVCVSRLAVGSSLVVAPPPPLLCLAVFVAAARCSFLSFLFFSCVVRPRCLWLSLVSGPGCPVPRRCAFFALLASRFSAPCALSPLSCFPPGRWLLPGGCSPPPPLCLPVFVAAAPCCVPCAVLCCVSLGVVLRCAAARCAARCSAVVCCVSLLRSFGAAAGCAVPSGAARRPGALCSAALCFAVFPRAVCSVLCVFCRGVVVRAVVRRSAFCCGCPGSLCCAFPVLSALCGSVLRCAGSLALCCSCGVCCCCRLVLWCAAVCCAVFFGVLWCDVGSGGRCWSADGVSRCRYPRLAARSASLWLVWLAVVPCFPVSCSVVLCCRVVLCCCALLSCCGAAGSCFALLWPVVLCCVVLLVGCAVLCPVVVSACCGALSPVLCVPCLLRSVCCCALLCWLWCPASLCCVLWRCAVAWCCAVVLCCHFAVLFVLALPSFGLSCGAVLCCGVLLIVCAVFCLVVAFVCCGALSLPVGTHATIPHTERNQAALFI